MTDKEKSTPQAEDFVRRVLIDNFKQKVDEETLHAVAEKVSQAVPANRGAADT